MLAKHGRAAIIRSTAAPRGRRRQRAGAAALAHDLIAGAEQEPDRHTPDMHEPCEGCDQEQRQPKDDMQFVDERRDRKSTRLNSSHVAISYAVFCLKKKRK